MSFIKAARQQFLLHSVTSFFDFLKVFITDVDQTHYLKVLENNQLGNDIFNWKQRSWILQNHNLVFLPDIFEKVKLESMNLPST